MAQLKVRSAPGAIVLLPVPLSQTQGDPLATGIDSEMCAVVRQGFVMWMLSAPLAKPGSLTWSYQVK